MTKSQIQIFLILFIDSELVFSQCLSFYLILILWNRLTTILSPGIFSFFQLIVTNLKFLVSMEIVYFLFLFSCS